MSRPPRQFFSLHELLIMAALAALGGMSSSIVSMVGAAVGAGIGLPGGLQFLAGIHVLWLVIAIGLVRKPGAATVTGLLKGAVELLSGNPHGPLVLAYSGLAGLAVDAIRLLLGGRDRPITYVLAGGVGAASNILVFKFAASLPSHRGVNIGLIVLAGVAFISGAVLAGLLGWCLLQALRRAGAAGVQPPGPSLPGARTTWARVGVLGAAIMLVGVAAYLAKARGGIEPVEDPPVTETAPDQAMTPR